MRYRASESVTESGFEPCSGRDSLPGTHHGRLPPCAGAACCAPLIRNAFGRSQSRKTTLASWTWCTEGCLTSCLIHNSSYVGSTAGKGSSRDRPRKILATSRIVLFGRLGAGKQACRSTQLLRPGSQGRQSRDRSMSRLFTAGLREPGADSVQC